VSCVQNADDDVLRVETLLSVKSIDRGVRGSWCIESITVGYERTIVNLYKEFMASRKLNEN
jgi:hypothetical protein